MLAGQWSLANAPFDSLAHGIIIVFCCDVHGLKWNYLAILHGAKPGGKLRKGGAMDRLYILAIAIVIAGSLSGGFYSVTGMGNGSAVINRFTGSTWACDYSGCVRLRF
jgi:hypothetical protein